MDDRIPALIIAAAGASPPFIVLGLSVWEYVHPLLIPQIEIDSLAADYVGRFGDEAAYQVTVEMERAAFRGETAEAGALRRVLKAVEGIQERLAQSG